jgi:type 2 lantibiotic biosynthesis protein LanM
VKTKWEWSDSGLIHADLRHPVLKELSNQPALSGGQISVQDYVSDIVNGFEEMYRFLLEKRERFCSSSLFTDLCSTRVRYLNRPTKEYVMILDRSLDVECLRDGLTRSIRLDLLCRSLLNRNRNDVWGLVGSERAALERLDIPYFTSRGNCRSLLFDKTEVVDFLEMNPREFLLKRIQHLDTADMNRQISWIRGSFAARYNKVKASRKEFSAWQEQEPLPREALLDEAVEIANHLIEQTIRSSDGSLTWIGIEFIPSVDQYQLQPMSMGLYGGLSGVALFFSALHHFNPDSAFADVARKAIQTIQSQRTSTRPNELMRQCGLGGMAGIASVAYSLAWSSRLLNDQSILDEGMSWAHLITKDSIQSERSLDFLSGIAGAIPALLRLYKWSGDENLLARTIDCGHRLIPVYSNVPGFSHGASGIGYALLELYEASNREEFFSAALIALQNETTSETPSWCNGAPGIALARLAIPSKFSGEIESGIRAAKNHGMNDVDHLCCGHSGRIETLLTAGKRLSQNQLCEVAARQMAAVILRAKANGTFHLMSDDQPGICNAGLLKGLAGIGYTCLRLADVENLLPSVLLME